MAKVYPELKSSTVIKRHPNPVLTMKDIPYKATCIYNAGVTIYRGQYVMIFRNDVRESYGSVPIDYIDLGLATSTDGVNWTVSEKPFLSHTDYETNEILRFYDPRLTVIEDKLYMCFAVDTRHGVCGGIGIIHNLERLEILSISVPDNRNMVLFPEKINGLYTRLERPFPVYSRGGVDRFDMWLSQSPDLKFWGNSGLVLAVEDVPYANDKVGPAAPPIKTDKGWLTIFHSVDIDPARGKNGWEDTWKKRYCAGIMLLDLNNPTKIVGMSKLPLMAPETYWEQDEGLRQNVIFPGGLILEDGENVKIYYGASDTVECLATAKLQDLIDLCTEPK